MAKFRILAVLLALTILFVCGCTINKEDATQNSKTRLFNMDSTLETISSKSIGEYTIEFKYDTNTLIEYVYVYHDYSEFCASSILYMPNETPKLYVKSQNYFDLITINSEDLGVFEIMTLYDSETLVMYKLSYNTATDEITIDPLYKFQSSNLKLYY